jgi:hypothetical protein
LLSKLRGDILSVGQDDDPNDIVSAFYSSVGGTQTLHLVKADGSEITASVPEPTVGTVTSVDLTASTGISVSGGPITTSGSITVTNTAPDQVVVLTGAGTTSISGTYPSFTITSNDQYVGTVTSVSTTAPITGGTITNTGTIGITQSGTASDGYLSSADWNTFNGKEPALTKGNLTETTSSVLTITGGTNAVIGTGTSIQVSQASSTTSGYLSSADWTTFNGKQDAITLTTTGTSGAATLVGSTLNIPDYTEQYSGTVTSVSTTAPITGGPITTTGTIGITQSGAASDGYLSSADWTTFNSKEPALTKGNLTEATSSVLTITNGTGAVIGSGTSIEVSQASSTTSGYLSSADWTTFNSKQGALTFTAPLVNTSGTITINQSGAASDGYLSSTDWTTFNSKEPALTKGNLTEATSSVLTITGGTGAVIGSGATIQVIQASSTTSGYLSSTDWTTFNGKASNSFTTIAVATQTNIVADSATDTLTIAAGTGVSITTDALTDTLTISATGSGGTVTSISTTAPITGGPITGIGTISITQSGTASDGYLSSADWNTFNGKQNAITLTTTGSSGAATLVGATLNIPQYTDQFTGTVTSVAALTLGTTGTDLSSTVANGTTTPVITLNVPTASATNRGALSSGDWTTFNGKQNAITLTTTGTSGAATLVGATLNIPQYTDQYTGTVTSVDLTAGTGISVSGGPITSSGSITVNNTDTGSSQDIFKTIAVSGQTNIVADSNNDTLTFAAGTGISITTNATTDTVTITNTGNPIPCFSAYSSTGVALTTDGALYDFGLDTETIKDSSVFTHSTSTDPDEITVLATGTYEISYSAAMINANSTTNDAAVVNVYIYKNGSSLVTALNTVQNVAHLNTSNYNYYNQIANSYIVSLTANDVIKLVALPSYLGGAGSSYGVVFGYLGNNNVTIKKLG